MSDGGVVESVRLVVSWFEDLGVINGVNGTLENPIPNKVTEIHVVGRSYEARERKGLA